MGKAKRKRAMKSAQNNPTGIISMKAAIETLEETNVDQTTTEMLISKMQHSDARERECACATLSTISKNKKNCERVISVDLLRSLSSLVLDSLPRIQETAAGALRNILSCLGDSHAHMIAQADVLTPFLSYLANSSKSNDLSKTNTVIIQALHVLLSACECGALSTAIAQRENITSCLIAFIKMKEHNEIAIAAAEVVNVLSEEISCFRDNDIQLLETCMDDCDITKASDLLLAVMLASCLHNLQSMSPCEHRHALMNKIVDVLLEALDRNAQQLVKEAKHAIESSMKTDDDVELFDQRKLSLSDECVVDVAISKADNVLRAQQVAMETLANICCPATDDYHDDSGSSVATDDDDDDEIVNEKLSQLMAPLTIACEVQTSLVAKHAPKRILERTRFYESDIYTCENQDDKFTRLIKSSLIVQSRALTCVQNMLAVLDPQQIGNKDVLLHLMHTFVELLERANGFAFMDETGEEFHEGLTGCFRALSQIFITQKIYELLPGHVLGRLREIATACDATMTKTNVISLFGKVGIAFSRKKFSEPVVSELVGIGNFLLDTAQSEDVKRLPVVAEAIDSLLDVFSSGKSAQVAAKQMLLLDRLRVVEPKFAMKIAEMKQTTDDCDVIENIHLNLARFIKYLKKQQNKNH